MVGRRGLKVDMRGGARLGEGLDRRRLVDVWGVDHIYYEAGVGVVRAAASVEELHQFREAVGAVQTVL